MQPPRRSENSPSTGAATASPGPYRIHVAAELSGVPAATLRAWERRYGLPVPRRTTTAYRLYTAEDVDLVRRMRELVDGGVAPSEAARTLLASAPNLADAAAEVDGLEVARERLLSATQRWDARGIDEELTRLVYLVDAQTLYGKVISPLLVEVGKRWKEGVLSVAQEHLLSEKLELTLRGELRALERPDGPLVLMACVEGELHVLGMLGAALRFAASGARVSVLGAATPPTALGEAVRTMAPRLVGLSATRTPSSPGALFKDYGKACGALPWVVGGAAASNVAATVESSGGTVAVGPGHAWSGQMRDWLRGGR